MTDKPLEVLIDFVFTDCHTIDVLFVAVTGFELATSLPTSDIFLRRMPSGIMSCLLNVLSPTELHGNIKARTKNRTGMYSINNSMYKFRFESHCLIPNSATSGIHANRSPLIWFRLFTSPAHHCGSVHPVRLPSHSVVRSFACRLSSGYVFVEG